MSSTTKTVLIILVVVFGFMILSSMFTGPTISETKPSEPLISKQEAFRQSFMGGCNPEGKSLGYCSCLWTKLDVKYSDSELEAVSAEYSKTGKLTQAFTDFAVECAKQYETELQGV